MTAVAVTILLSGVLIFLLILLVPLVLVFR
jgi:hypothetical protein